MLLAATAVALVLVFVGAQAFWAWRLALLYPPLPRTSVADSDWLRVAVLLPTRGADPSLARCLEGLLDQDYPSYDIRIIVDSATDPAWKIVREVLAKRPSVDVKIALLERRLETCSLKVSALLQGLAGLDESCQAVALIDADVAPHRKWLRDLTAPLHDPKVGATTGVRWYITDGPQWGSLVRMAWGAAAATQMVAFGIPWAGSMAFRTDVLRRANVMEKWAKCLCEDVPLESTLHGLGLRLHFVLAATMVNCESIDLKRCYQFIRRQMISVRLYHRRWPLLLAFGVGSPLALMFAVGAIAAALASVDYIGAVAVAGTLILCLTGLFSGTMWIDGALRGMARSHGERLPRLPMKTVLAVPLMQFVYLAALLSATFARRVEWRGAAYELLGPMKLRLVEYQPYHAEAEEQDSRASVV
jgi:glycosyltransferase involved in cell wall biosynthesis